MFSKHRLEALSDGIFAIAMTLLVLDLKVPDGPLPPHFGRMLAQEWVGVVITFVIAATYWTLQHRIFELIPDVHERALLPTFVFLGLISVLPFSTGYFSHHIGWRSGYVVYFTHACLIGAVLLIKLEMLVHYQSPDNALAIAKLRLRLGTVCFAMGAAAIGAALLPLKIVGIWTAGAAVLARVFVRTRKAALERKHARPVAG